MACHIVISYVWAGVATTDQIRSDLRACTLQLCFRDKDFCTPLRLAPSVSSGVLVRFTDTKLRNETRGTNAEIAISSK